MFKFLVISTLLCVAAAAPGLLHGGYALPAATSYSSRVDVVHSTPILKTYAAPAVVAAPVIAKTVSYAAPVVAKAVSYPVVADYGLEHGYGYGLGHGVGLEHGYGGLGYGHGW